MSQSTSALLVSRLVCENIKQRKVSHLARLDEGTIMSNAAYASLVAALFLTSSCAQLPSQSKSINDGLDQLTERPSPIRRGVQERSI